MSVSLQKQLLLEADDAVKSAAYSPRKLVLIHSGLLAGVYLLALALQYGLSQASGGAGGLAGLGTQAMLETAQVVLTLAVQILSPFWEAGLVLAALMLFRRQNPGPRVLLSGFSRLGPVLRLLILEAIVYFAVVLVSAHVGSFFYMLSPASQPLTELTEQLMQAGSDAAMQEILQSLDQHALMSLLLGMLPYILIPALLLMIPLSYRLRLAQFVVMDEPRVGALYALSQSMRLMRRRCKRLFLLDLRFWWFYALELVVLAVCYGDVLLPYLGVSLAMSPEAASLVFYAVGLALQLALHWWTKPQVMTAYAGFYNRLRPRQEENKV